MAARFSLLATLRRSMIGAWLACAYALAVVAAGLAPSPAAAWPAELGAPQLCSGDAAPGSETPSEPAHCKGCLASWPVALPPDVTAHVPLRLPVVLEAAPHASAPAHAAAPFGLQPSRGPPLG